MKRVVCTHCLLAASFGAGCALTDALGGDDRLGDSRSLPVFDRPNAVVAGDFDGDGLQDLAFASDTGTLVGTFRGQKGGDLQIGPSIELSRGSPWLATADFDGDGLDDVAAAGCDNIALIRAANGFTFTVSPAQLALPNCPIGLRAGNFDGVGLPDLVAIVEASPDVFVFTQGETPGFTEQLTLRQSGDVRALAVGDVDADRIDEIAVGYGNMQGITVLGGSLGQKYGQAFTFAPVYALAVADLDRDGRGDLIYSADCGRCAHLGIAYGMGGGTFMEAGSQTGGSTGARALGVGNFDRRGLLDVFGSGYPAPPDLLVIPVLNRGSYGRETSRALGGAPGGLAVLDIDADGDDDAVLAITSRHELVVVRSE